MTTISAAPQVNDLTVPIDAWTKPFWDAAAEHCLLLPACGDCGTFRWPPGPFCPACQSQVVDWQPAGAARIFSYTAVRPKSREGEAGLHIPALVEFPDSGGVRLLAAIVGAAIDNIRIGAAVEPDWITAANAEVPIFRLVQPI